MSTTPRTVKQRARALAQTEGINYTEARRKVLADNDTGCLALGTAKIGDQVRFTRGSGWWTVRARDERFIIATTPEPTAVKGIVYTVVDLTGWTSERSGVRPGVVRSSLNTLGGGWNLGPNGEGCEEILAALQAGEREISQRRVVAVNFVDVRQTADDPVPSGAGEKDTLEQVAAREEWNVVRTTDLGDAVLDADPHTLVGPSVTPTEGRSESVESRLGRGVHWMTQSIEDFGPALRDYGDIPLLRGGVAPLAVGDTVIARESFTLPAVHGGRVKITANNDRFVVTASDGDKVLVRATGDVAGDITQAHGYLIEGWFPVDRFEKVNP